MSYDGAWFYKIGPLEAAAAAELQGRLEALLDRESMLLNLADHRTWFAGPFDVDTIRALIPVLVAGLAETERNSEIYRISSAFLNGIETWLGRDYDEALDVGEE